MNDKNLSRPSSDILVVDDVLENLKLLVNLLTQEGYKVRPASSGAEAMDAVKRKKTDLILLDIKMPGMDGFEVCKRLKADSQLKKIPIIFISGLSETDDKVQAFRAGGVDYITKPIQEEEVLIRVQTHLELQRMRMNLESTVAERTVDLRMSEERLRESRENYRNIVEQAQDGIALLQDGKIIFASTALTSLIGYEKKKIENSLFEKFVAKSQVARISEIYRKRLKNKDVPAIYESVLRHKNGQEIEVEFNVGLTSYNGKPGVLGIIRDITDRKKAEREILKNREHLKKAQDVGQIGSWELDLIKDNLYWSEQVYTIFEIDKGEANKYELFLAKVYSEDRAYVDQSWKSALNGDPYDIEHRIETPSGIKWVREKVSVEFDDQGTATRGVGVVQDITDRKKFEEEVNKSEKNLKLIYNTTRDVLFQLQVEPNDCFRFLSVNLAFLTATGLTEKQIIGKTTKEIIPGPSHTLALEKYKEAIRDKRIVRWEETTEYPTGVKVGDVAVTPAFDEDGNCSHLIGSVHDITDKKKAEKVLREREAMLSTLFNAPLEIIMLLNRDGTVLSINESGARRFNKSPEALIGQNIYKFMEGEVLNHRKSYSKEVIRTGKSIHFLDEREGKYFENNVYPVFDTDGENVVSIAVFASDITERMLAEQALEKEVEFQKLVAKISTLFINIPIDKIDQTINNQFKEIGEFFNADRVTIAYLPEKGEPLPPAHMWFSDKKIAEKITTLMMGATYPNLVNYLKDQEYWSFSVLEPDKYSHWLPERETIEKTDFKSGLVINTGFEKSILEIFVIDVMHANRVWKENTIEQVKLLGNVFSNALHRKHAEQALEKEAEFKQLVSQLSTRFTGLSGVEFEHAIENSLVEVGSYFGVDAVRLFQLSPKGEVLKFRLMWQSEHLAPQHEMTEIHKMTYPELAAHYSRGEPIIFRKLDDGPQWPEVRKILKFFGTKSGVGVPLESDKSGVDVFAMDSVMSEYQWPEDIIEQSEAVGRVLLSAILRREAEVIIQNGYSEIKRLKDQLQQENIYLKEEIKLQNSFDKIIGQSASLNYVLHRLEQVAPTNATVLIHGETGTGKELFANALHGASKRKGMPLINVGCASLSTTLIESEFFGHEKGAFTGADKQRIGRFELANKGTIFLDEIGELSLELQAKLLRVLQEGEIERLGSSKTIKVDVRVIAATNRNLEKEVKEGRFREDLYYRLATFKLSVPPLRDRIGDIPPLVRFFTEKSGRNIGKNIKSIPKSSMNKLENYSWPGNIRELQNTIENAIIISENEILKVELPGSSILSKKGKMKLKDIERDHIIEVLNSTNWRLGGKGGAAELLGMKRTTLYAKMKKYEIERKI